MLLCIIFTQQRLSQTKERGKEKLSAANSPPPRPVSPRRASKASARLVDVRPAYAGRKQGYPFTPRGGGPLPQARRKAADTSGICFPSPGRRAVRRERG